MSQHGVYLPGEQPRGRWMRLDAAQILTRFFFCERALLTSAAAWIPWIPSLEIKTELPRFIWQNALTAHALRERIFELRHPSRALDEQPYRVYTALFGEVKHAPSLAAFLLGVGRVLLPALADAYRAYLAESDPIADGPTYRFLELALTEKERQARVISAWAESALAQEAQERSQTLDWREALVDRLATLGGIRLEPVAPSTPFEPLPQSRPYFLPDKPAHDPRFHLCRFYWPDIVDPDFPYGEGLRLQLRAAVSHLNEVWAIESAGVVLSAFADTLPWEWIDDASRWMYDAARHCRMGYDRLLSWGLDPAGIPLGSYLYESAAGQAPLYRLGMLYFFETKNLKHKSERARLFATYGDMVSRHDMEFDWADDTVHAGYGKHWLTELLKRHNEAQTLQAVSEHCQDLVNACVQTATPEEIETIRQIANVLIEKANRRT